MNASNIAAIFTSCACLVAPITACGVDDEADRGALERQRVGLTVEERLAALEELVSKQSEKLEMARAVLDRLSVDENGDVLLTGANLRVVNGRGFQQSTNGKGNIIVGYQKMVEGSHNILVGQGNRADSYGSIVGGLSNHAAAPYASVISGMSNTARAEHSVILTGSSIQIGESNDSAAVTSGVNLSIDEPRFAHKTVIGMGGAAFAAQTGEGNAGLVLTEDYRP